MSKKISTIGKVWLIFLMVLACFGIVANFMEAGKGILFIISGIICIGELISLIFLIQGKGINYFFVYCGCYLINAVLGFVATTEDKSVPYITGFILGIVINIGLTYLATKDTFKK